MAVAERLPGQLATELLGAARTAFTHAFQAAAAAAAVVALIAAVVAIVLMRRTRLDR